MGSTVTNFCDRCKKTVDRRNDLLKIELHIGPVTQNYAPPVHTYEWCRKCIVETGMSPHYKESGVTQPEIKPTFEELLKELLGDLLEDRIVETVQNTVNP